jgi:nucleotide-binding universal stress UspA family protein
VPSGGDKGLKKNAIGFASSVVIGVASTAPGYSLAATLGFIAAAVALQSPAILLISFVPMFLVAAGYYYMNKADPDCGTSFSWVTKAPPGIWGGEIAEHEEAIEEFGESVTGEAKRRLDAEGVPAEIAMVPKRGPEALVDVAGERDARMIVVGSYGDPPLKGVILGSTPNKLLHLAERPVLVVPAKR